jgi:monoamine oxidase
VAHDTDVVVVGAGLAGLAAARALTDAGIDCVVVEARDRVGGRTLSVVEEPGVVIDHGGQWIGPTQDRVLAWVDELGVETFTTYCEGENLQLRRGELSRYVGAIPTSDPLMAADLVEAMLALTMTAMSVDPAAPWDHPLAEQLDGTTVESWIAVQPFGDDAKEWLRLVCRAVFPAEPREISLLHALFYVRSAGSLERLLGVVNAAQETRFVHGALQLSERMAEPIAARIRLGERVTRIDHGHEGVVVHTDTGTVSARRAIVTLPPTLAGRLRYDPPLSGMRDQLTQRSWMGSVIKVHAVYDEPFWRTDGLSGQVTSDTGPVRLTFDNSPATGSSGVIVGFLEADDARRASRLDAHARRSAVLDCLASYFGERARTPVAYYEKSWMEEEFTRGCYVGIMSPGTWYSYGPSLREPIGPIRWAGTETAIVWNGYMDGAIRSGEDAAAALVAELGEDGGSRG